jgi:tetratricopeptide (TPR) repeat protein
MKANRSTLLALGLPLLLGIAYVILMVAPWAGRERPSRQLTAAESSILWSDCKSLFSQSKYHEALAAALKLHDAYPGNHLYLEVAAESYGRMGDHQHEAEFWEKYFDSAPNPVAACPQIGEAYWKQGRTDEAIAAYERCLARNPENADSIFYLAHALELAGKLDRAADLYRRGLEIAPEYEDMKVGLARVWLRQGKAAQAERASENILQHSPDSLGALLVAGLASFSQGQLPKAKEYLAKGVKLYGADSDFHEALATIAEQEKDFPEALRQYDVILKQHPDDRRIEADRNTLRAKAP